MESSNEKKNKRKTIQLQRRILLRPNNSRHHRHNIRRGGNKISNKVYIINNKETNKNYIGQTKRSIDERLKEHIRKAQKPGNDNIYHTPLSISIRETHPEALRIAILADNIPDNEIDEVEAHYIQLYNTIQDGYNTSPGYNDTSNHINTEYTEKKPDPVDYMSILNDLK